MQQRTAVHRIEAELRSKRRGGGLRLRIVACSSPYIASVMLLKPVVLKIFTTRAPGAPCVGKCLTDIAGADDCDVHESFPC